MTTMRTLKLLSYVRHLLVDPLLLELSDACTADIRNELNNTYAQVREVPDLRIPEVPASSLACSSPS